METVATPPPAGLLQVPGLMASLKVVVAPVHITDVPVIANGTGLTVTTAVVKHPVVLNV